MHWPTTKVLMDKITALYRQLGQSQGNMTAMERDLLLDYLRQLYDQILTAQTSTSSAGVPPPPPPPRREAPVAPMPEPAPPPVFQVPPVTPVVHNVAPPAVTPAEPVEKKPVAASLTPPQTTADAPPLGHDVPAEIKNLFNPKYSTELSDKLAMMPIADIKKGLGINDRMQVVHELFAKNSELFERYMTMAQNAAGYDEACRALYSVAIQNNWASDEKQPTAQLLIKVLRRRFAK